MPRGGYRPGAGRPKGSKNVKNRAKKDLKSQILNDPETPEDEKKAIKEGEKTPLRYMLEVMNNAGADPDRRDKMAIQAAPYVHAKASAGGGKKEEKQNRAKKAGQGRFSPTAPPKLASIKGGK